MCGRVGVCVRARARLDGWPFTRVCSRAHVRVLCMGLGVSLWWWFTYRVEPEKASLAEASSLRVCVCVWCRMDGGLVD